MEKPTEHIIIFIRPTDRRFGLSFPLSKVEFCYPLKQWAKARPCTPPPWIFAMHFSPNGIRGHLMYVGEVMTRNADCVGPEATLVSVLSDCDITLCCAGRNPRTARGTMPLEVYYCFEDDDLANAAELMQEMRVRRLLVLNRDKRLVGVIGFDDLTVEDCCEQTVGHTLEVISAPSSRDIQLAP